MLGRVEYKEHEIRNHSESSGNLSTLLSLSLTHTHTNNKCAYRTCCISQIVESGIVFLGGKRISAHKIVLGKHKPYFHSCMTEICSVLVYICNKE